MIGPGIVLLAIAAGLMGWWLLRRSGSHWYGCSAKRIAIRVPGSFTRS